MKEFHQSGDLRFMGETALKVESMALEPGCLYLNPGSTAFKECNLSCQMRIKITLFIL